MAVIINLFSHFVLSFFVVAFFAKFFKNEIYVALLLSYIIIITEIIRTRRGRMAAEKSQEN